MYAWLKEYYHVKNIFAFVCLSLSLEDWWILYIFECRNKQTSKPISAKLILTIVMLFWCLCRLKRQWKFFAPFLSGNVNHIYNTNIHLDCQYFHYRLYTFFYYSIWFIWNYFWRRKALFCGLLIQKVVCVCRQTKIATLPRNLF